MRRFLLVACLALVFTAPARAGLNLWTTGGPTGGAILDLAFDPGDPEVVYAGTLGGVFRSEDHGATWTAANLGLAGAVIHDLEVVPGSPGSLYAATGGGLQRSDDGGRTWQIPTFTLGLHALALDPSNPQILYAARQGAILKSTDGGASWISLDTMPDNEQVIFLEVDPLAPATVYAGTVLGLFRSTGGTFAPLLGLNAELLVSLAIDPTASQILYAGTSTGVYKSTDRGLTWSLSGLVNQYVQAIAVDPASPSTLLALANGVFRSTDAGASWNLLDIRFISASMVAFDPSSPSTAFIGDSAGVFKSTNGGASWLLSSTGITATTVTGLAADPHRPGTLYALAGQGELHKSADAGATWSRIDGISGIRTFALDPKTPSLLYAATNDGFLRSQNGGGAWVRINASETAGNRIAIDPQTPSTLYLSRYPEGIRKSLDGGITWSTAGPEVEGFFLPDVLVVAPSEPRTVFAADFYNGLFKSTDGGAAWTAVPITGLTHSVLNTLAVDPHDADVLYAALMNDRIYKSTDGGATWVRSGHGLSFPNVDGIAIDPFQPSRLYATNLSQGIFRSTDGGATWLPFNDGRLAGLWMDQIVLDPVNPHLLYASTAGAGVLARADLQPGDSLRLNGDRFRVKMSWATGQGPAGPGHTQALTGDTGYAWFFQESNVEVLLKVLNGCGLNGRFWVFAAGLTNVRTDITVADTQTGAVKIYHNPPGQPFQPIQDTNALACSGAADGIAASQAPSAAAGGPILLRDGRFRVTAEFAISPIAAHHPAQGALLTDDAAYLWFFDHSNVEVFLKVVDGCAVNGRFWVFVAGLTNLEVRITVEDTKTSASKVYVNPAGTAFQPILDTSAFEECG